MSGMDPDYLLTEMQKCFHVYNYELVDGGYRFYVIPFADRSEIKRLMLKLQSEYDVSVRDYYGEVVVEVRKRRERIWINIVLLLATVATTTIVGSTFYGEKLDLFGGFVFSMAIMFVLGSHEMGHYIAARRWGMKTSLPYFIPFPTLIGTLGAVIKHRGAIPSRKALFDVGVSGPLTGIAASVIVTLIGFTLPFHPAGKPMLVIGTPPIFDFLMWVSRFNGFTIHPVAFAGWVGFFVTFLNMIPVGQLDGGHVLRAMIGKSAEKISKIIPIALLALGIAVARIYHQPDSIWFFWSIIAFFFSLHGHPEPLDDETKLDPMRYFIGIFAFILAAACFTPVPFYMYMP